MDVGPLVVADTEASKLIEPGKCPLDDPAPSSQTAAVLGTAHRQQRQDAASSQPGSDCLCIVVAVSHHTIWATPRPSPLALEWKNRIHQRRCLLRGYSSLSYLTQLPIDALKVDQSFVHELTPDPDGGCTDGAALIVNAVIGMGKGLRHRVIAEGIETAEQLACLQAQHCDEGQGFYFSPPLVAEEFAKVLKAGTVPMSGIRTPRTGRAGFVAQRV